MLGAYFLRLQLGLRYEIEQSWTELKLSWRLGAEEVLPDQKSIRGTHTVEVLPRWRGSKQFDSAEARQAAQVGRWPYCFRSSDICSNAVPNCKNTLDSNTNSDSLQAPQHTEEESHCRRSINRARDATVCSSRGHEARLDGLI